MRRFLAAAGILLGLCGTALGQEASWTVEDIFSPRFATKSLASVEWIDGGRKFSYFESDSAKQRSLLLYDVTSGKRETVIDRSRLVPQGEQKPMKFGSYEWSADGKRILITEGLPARRTKTGGRFGIFDVVSQKFTLLSDETDNAIVKFSPDGRKIGFVRSNNLFVRDVATGTERQLTFDGSGNILNGRFDWVYEEEFSIIDGWEWSPDSKRIAFWRLDQSAVPTFPLVRYAADDPHATVENMHYPKAGDPNSLVQIGIITVEDGSIRWLDLGPHPDIYVPRIKWTNNPSVLSVQRLNRGQDTLDIMLANATDGSLKTILTETDSAWLEVERDEPLFLKDGKRFTWVSWRDGFTHIYLYHLDGKLERQLTTGWWDVSDVVGVDADAVYFIAAKESPLERHLYRVRLDGSGLTRLTGESGWHAAEFSPDMSQCIDTYSAVGRPPQTILRKANGAPVATVVENTRDAWKGKPATTNAFFSFTTHDGVALNGFMLKPADFDPAKKYPVLMYVYGAGPQTVTNRWGGRNFLWYQLLAEHGYIIASVDPRGTDGRGREFRQSTNRALGYKNTQDLMEAARYLAALPYVDGARIGIWGWSGGGYHTLMAMTMGAEYFKTGIAVAAVTDFRFYDTIWTERYMDTPQSNPEGYKKTSVLTYADKLKGNLLMVHGTTDDNVHWQNEIVLANEFIKDGRQFDVMFYPDRKHGISDAAAQKHLFTKMTAYILGKL